MNERQFNPANAEDFHLRIAAAHLIDSFNSVAFSPDGQWLASGSSDKTVKLWDAASGSELQTFGQIPASHFFLRADFLPPAPLAESFEANSTRPGETDLIFRIAETAPTARARAIV